MSDYPCACGCGLVIEFIDGSRRQYANDACRVRQYRRDHPDYVRADAEQSLRRKRESYSPVTPPSVCLCGCGNPLPARAGNVGRHPLYVNETCRRRAREAA